MFKAIKRRLIPLVVVFCALGVMLPVQDQVSAEAPKSSRVLVFVSDGMRQDLMVQYAENGKMPTYEKILDKGVQGQNGMIPNVPPNTGPGWTSLITGASPSLTGVTNNTYHDNTKPFTSYGTSAWGYGVNQAETLAEKADAEGLTVAALGWQAFDTASVPNGVVVEYYPDWLTGRGVVTNFELALEWTTVLTPSPVLAYNQVTLADATGWTNAPTSYSVAKETAFSISDWMYMPVLTYDVYVYDSTNDSNTNYDKALIADTKDAAAPLAVLGQGEWSDSISATVNDWYGNPNIGGFYVKAINLAPDLSQFRLYYSQVTRIRAVPQSLEDDLASRFGAVMPMDYSPYILGLVDVETFIEQHTMATELLGTEIYPYVLKTYKPDLALVGVEWTDMNQHRFLGRCFPGSDSYDPNTADQYCEYVEGAYETSDKALEAVWGVMNDANVFVTSDHGFSVTDKAISASYVLSQAGLYTPGNYATSKAVPYAAGGTLQVYINLEGRNPGGIVPASEYELVRQQVVDAFAVLGPDMIERIVLKEDTAAIETALGQTYNMLNENTTGDVVVFSAPPYQFDAASPVTLTNDAPIYGQHGFVPNGDLDRYAVFAAYGPKIRRHVDEDPIVTVLDLAPTAAHLLGIDAPAQSQGVVLDILKY